MGLLNRVLLLGKTKTSAALDRIEDPRQVMDFAFAQQQELLVKVKRGLVEVATSKAQLVRQARRLHERIPQCEAQAAQALELGRDDLALGALQRKQVALAELEALETQVAEVGEEEARLAAVQQTLAVRIEEFRSRRNVMSARYTAAGARVRVNEALGGISGEMAELGLALGRAEEKTERLQARASALDSLIDADLLLPAWSDGEPVAAELRRLGATHAAETELIALRLQIGQGADRPALEATTQTGKETS